MSTKVVCTAWIGTVGSVCWRLALMTRRCGFATLIRGLSAHQWKCTLVSLFDLFDLLSIKTHSFTQFHTVSQFFLSGFFYLFPTTQFHRFRQLLVCAGTVRVVKFNPTSSIYTTAIASAGAGSAPQSMYLWLYLWLSLTVSLTQSLTLSLIVSLTSQVISCHGSGMSAQVNVSFLWWLTRKRFKGCYGSIVTSSCRDATMVV